MQKFQINKRCILFIALILHGFTMLAQNSAGNRVPMTETTVAGKWYVIVNKKTGRSRKALCSVPFNTFQFCQHPGTCYKLLPTYRVDRTQSCQCEDVGNNNKMVIRIPTKLLHLIAINSLDKVQLSGDSMKITLPKRQSVAIRLNYKGKSFSAIKNFKQMDSGISDSSDRRLLRPELTYVSFVERKSFIPSNQFPALDSTIIALKQHSDLKVSLVSYRRNQPGYKNTLAKSRGLVVQQYLINAGIKPNRVELSILSTKKRPMSNRASAQNCLFVKVQ